MEKGHVRENFPFKLIGPLGQEMDQPPCFGNISSFLLLSAPWGWRQWAGGPWGEPADQELPRCLLSLAEKEKNGNCINIILICKVTWMSSIHELKLHDWVCHQLLWGVHCRICQWFKSQCICHVFTIWLVCKGGELGPCSSLDGARLICQVLNLFS